MGNNLRKMLLIVLFLSIPQICYSYSYPELLDRMTNEKSELDKIGDELSKLMDKMVEDSLFNSEIEFHQSNEAQGSIANVSTIINDEIQFLSIIVWLKKNNMEEYYDLRITGIQLSKAFLIRQLLILKKDYKSIKNEKALKMIDKAMPVIESLLDTLDEIEKKFSAKDMLHEQEINKPLMRM